MIRALRMPAVPDDRGLFFDGGAALSAFDDPDVCETAAAARDAARRRGSRLRDRGRLRRWWAMRRDLIQVLTGVDDLHPGRPMNAATAGLLALYPQILAAVLVRLLDDVIPPEAFLVLGQVAPVAGPLGSLVVVAALHRRQTLLAARSEKRRAARRRRHAALAAATARTRARRHHRRLHPGPQR